MTGWKDILRPIRDGVRDRLPKPTPPQEDDEARRKRLYQQRVDALKGFAYCDNFDELVDWKAENADPLQRSNIPLLSRAPCAEDVDLASDALKECYVPENHKRYLGDPIIESTEKEQNEHGKAKVILCHDYAGNYQDYEAVQGCKVDVEGYSCEYLQYIDTFVYFSHKLVCAPPPSWTNTLHRNGVKVLGTFLIEPQTPGIEKLIDDSKGFLIAKQLAKMASHLGFDGWLINIENRFDHNEWDLPKLLNFLAQLRAELGESRDLIWYDALTIDNHVAYQNSLSKQNLPMAQASGSILTNYRWTENKLHQSNVLSQIVPFPSSSIFFGIDVWAQNAYHSGPRRITYPEHGGGGTNTGIAVAKLAETVNTACIFAPAWSFEHFGAHGRDVERAMWEGIALSDSVKCDCPGPDLHRTPQYTRFPITKSAKRYPGGSETFFYTNFSRAFSASPDSKDKEKSNLQAHLSAQSLTLPIYMGEVHDKTRLSNPHITGHPLSNPSRVRISISGDRLSDNDWRHSSQYEAYIALCHLNMPLSHALTARVRCRAIGAGVLHLPKIVVADENGWAWEQALQSDKNDAAQTIDIFISPHTRRRARVTAVGVYARGFQAMVNGAGRPLPLIDVLDICVQPSYRFRERKKYTIGDTQHHLCGEFDLRHRRLTWCASDEEGNDIQDRANDGDGDGRVPWSSVTGPFDHFEIIVDGVCVGMAYAWEFVLGKDAAKRLDSEEGIKVKIIGVGFGGHRIESGDSVALKDEAGDWEIV